MLCEKCDAVIRERNQSEQSRALAVEALKKAKELLLEFQVHGYYPNGVTNEIVEGVRKITNEALSSQPPLTNKKICDEPDNCTFSDCPTAFCDKNKPLTGIWLTKGLAKEICNALDCDCVDEENKTCLRCTLLERMK